MSVGEGTGVLRPSGERGGAPGAGLFGLGLFLASLTMLFAGSIVAYCVVRSQARVWPPADAPPLPWGMWVATGLLALSSLSVQRALGAIRAGSEQRLRRLLVGTLVLASAFVAVQAANWWIFAEHDATFHRHLYGFTFYMLTGLHGAHVLGGIVALVVVTVRAFLGHYSWAYYPGVRYAAAYWHYLGVVWLVLFALLLLDRVG